MALIYPSMVQPGHLFPDLWSIAGFSCCFCARFLSSTSRNKKIFQHEKRENATQPDLKEHWNIGFGSQWKVVQFTIFEISSYLSWVLLHSLPSSLQKGKCWKRQKGSRVPRQLHFWGAEFDCRIPIPFQVSGPRSPGRLLWWMSKATFEHNGEGSIK